MTEILELREAVAGAVHDGDTVALEGFTHLIPTAATPTTNLATRVRDRRWSSPTWVS